MPLALSSGSQYVAVAATSAKFTNAMRPGQIYRLTVNTDCWLNIGATGGAAQASTADNVLVLSGQTVYLTGPHYSATDPSSSTTTNAFVHLIRNSADGKATLTPLVQVPG